MEHKNSEIYQLGNLIDERLVANDVRLTMGTEATFFSPAHAQLPEWINLALGPHKKNCAKKLLKSLQEIYAPGSMILHADGKWYAGENVPRWSYNCYWRKDQISLWPKPELLIMDEDDQASYNFSKSFAFAQELLSAKKYLSLNIYTDLSSQQICVNFSPHNSIDEYLEIVQEVALAAEKFQQKIRIVGAEPPCDKKLACFKVVPDPGVLEINTPAFSSWDEIFNYAEIMFAKTKELGLSAQKFLADGRSVGTGGGNHIVIGGANITDSPLLRNVGLLRSIITFWQHHPALSYLFSGHFVGPTSQAPRIDEVRNGYLHDIEMALNQLDHIRDKSEQESLDFLRHFMIDLTGNTHRAEICIDKLFKSNNPAALQGLLEFRAFEMPPDQETYLLQLLLIRGLVAYLWEHPYHKKLLRWGNELHDRFLLPEFLWEDFSKIISELVQHNYHFDLNWFKPFYELKFPRIGQINCGEINFELRFALEPWPVLSGELLSAGTSRTVDAATDRLQVKVSGCDLTRYGVVCNNIILPLQPTKNPQEYVAGVRFKARNLALTLHPQIPQQEKLSFAVVDLKNRIAVLAVDYIFDAATQKYVFQENKTREEIRWRNEEPTEDHPGTLDLRGPSLRS